VLGLLVVLVLGLLVVLVLGLFVVLVLVPEAVFPTIGPGTVHTEVTLTRMDWTAMRGGRRRGWGVGMSVVAAAAVCPRRCWCWTEE
jgi:hypothetical protein